MFFFINYTATTEIYTLSLHDALPISRLQRLAHAQHEQERGQGADHEYDRECGREQSRRVQERHRVERSEEHTSELQSQSNLVCRLLLEKKKTKYIYSILL